MLKQWSRAIRMVVAGATMFAAAGVFAQYNPRALMDPQAAVPVTEPEAFEAQWPMQVPGPSGQITIFQPQMEELVGDMLSARAAVSIAAQAGAEAVYGVVWFKGRISTDRVSRVVQVTDVKITQTRIPEAPSGTEQAVHDAIARGMTAGQAELSLDQLLEMLETKQPAQAALQFDAPTILFVDHPAMKVQYDGNPDLRPVKNSPLQRVMNTPFFVVLDPVTKTFFLKGGGVWYDAIDAMGPFQRSSRVPQEAITLADQSGYKDPQEPLPAAQLERLEIITATEPTELVWSDGSPHMGAVPGTGLLYVTNTDSSVFVAIDTQRIYVLLSGRWYEAATRSGPWTFVPPGNLPADFAKIPATSERGDVLAHIAGTPQAKQAVADTLVPQTAAVNRLQFEQPRIEYDGDPFFEPVKGASANYAVNTPQSVVQIGNTYYACYNAVWYSSATPNGPWDLCTDVPAAVYDIPASSPLYPVTYVRTYGYTPEYAYYGYTPGYLGTYAYDGVVVYGTGYRYRPWFGDCYYPRAYTYGFGARYDCYSNNWGFAFGYGWGGGSLWIGYGGGGYWNGCDPWFGYGGYRPCATGYSYGRYPYRYDYRGRVHDWGHHDEDRARDNRDHDRDRRAMAFGNERNANARQENVRSGNVYERRNDVRQVNSSRTRNADRSAGQPPRGDPDRRTDQRNNVLADRDGRVFRRTNDGDWEVRDNGNWRSEGRSPAALASEPAARQVARASRSTDLRSTSPGTPRVRSEVRVNGSNSEIRAGRSTPVDRRPVVIRPTPSESQSSQALSQSPARNSSSSAARNNPYVRTTPSNTESRNTRSQVADSNARRTSGQPPLAAAEVRSERSSGSSDRVNAGGQGNRPVRVAPPAPAPREVTRDAPREVRSRPSVESRPPAVQRSEPAPRQSASPRSEPSRSADSLSRPSRIESSPSRGGGGSSGRRDR